MSGELADIGHGVLVDHGRSGGMAFRGSGGAISQAASSLMATGLISKGDEEPIAKLGNVHSLLAEPADDEDAMAHVTWLVALPGVPESPMEVTCAAWAGDASPRISDHGVAPNARK